MNKNYFPKKKKKYGEQMDLAKNARGKKLVLQGSAVI
jgi:hypothetical protein